MGAPTSEASASTIPADRRRFLELSRLATASVGLAAAGLGEPGKIYG